MTKIKICGLSRPEDITYVNEAKPDYCGFVIHVPKSRRNVLPGELITLREKLAEGICPVGVFVNEDPKLVARLLNDGTIHIAQLHGQEDGSYIERLRSMTDHRIMQACSVSSVEDLQRACASRADMILLDHGKGGTGHSFDWSLLAEHEQIHRRVWFLAGGISAENIPEVIRRFQPDAVDLSSSVETEGRKDRENILAAVAAVRSMDV